MEKYHTEIIKQLDNSLIKQWKELWSRGENSTVFNSYEWFLTCQQTYNLKNYEIYVCYDKEGKLVALLPLTNFRKFGIKVAGTIANDFLVDTAFLVEKSDPKLLKYFFNNIISKRNLFVHKVDENSAKKLHKIFPKMFFSLISVNPFVDLSTDPLLTISKSTVQQIKKILRKNPGQLTFNLYDNQDNLQKQLETMIKIDQASSKKLRSMELFSKQEIKDFYNNLIINCNHYVQIGFLYFNDIPVAYQFGFLHNNIFEAYQTAYLNDYGKIRPGKTMLFHLIETLKENKINKLDLGGGISSYKQEFTPEFNFHYDLYYSKNLLIMKWWKFINALRRNKQILFPKKFTKDHEYLFSRLS